ncbi:MAG: glycosyltransferase [Chloroflexi bacterium]|nr:glycosyltransferase [Chloroflexota bacterium]MBI5713087.1 glycosyltransferase [Chloroflexota bacterium]
MKFLFLDTYYTKFLHFHYRRHPQLETYSYNDQLRSLLDQCFGTSDFYSENLRALGHEAHDLIPNCVPLQRQWAKENGRALWRSCPLESDGARLKVWQHAVIAAQLEKFRPDVLYVQNMKWTDTDLLRMVHDNVRLVIGQTASPLPEIDLSGYDLVLSSFPHFVAQLKRMGVASEYLRIAFEPRVLTRIPKSKRDGVIFLGSYSPDHQRGTTMLEAVARHCPLEFWGQGVESLSPDSPIRRTYRGEAWGIEMYRVLSSSHIALNRHIEVSGRFANNMRLYEATGVGTLLITDAKENLEDLFETDQEVVAYRSADECVEKIRYYLDHEEEREKIAQAGQTRTLRDHTYANRMEEVSSFVEKYARASVVTPRDLVRVWKRDHFRRVWRRRSLSLLKRAEKLPGIRRLKWEWERRRRAPTLPRKVSYGYQRLSASQSLADLRNSWRDPNIPLAQRALVNDDLRKMYFGFPSLMYQMSARAVARTDLVDPLIVEVGCASGYYSEVLSHLCGGVVNYVGLDYSFPLVSQGKGVYPHLPLINGDACHLPFGNSACDILFSGTVLLHVPDYESVIAESARVSKQWCIFHRTPIFERAPTAAFSKFAYGVCTVEYAFNRDELFRLFDRHGLEVIETYHIEQYTLPGADEVAQMKTYLTLKRS